MTLRRKIIKKMINIHLLITYNNKLLRTKEISDVNTKAYSNFINFK